MTSCGYSERDRECRTPAVWEYPKSWAHPAWPLCERHIKPEFWPADLRKKLPGMLRRLVIRAHS